MPALSLHAIAKHFGPVQALAGVHFAVEAGSVHALLGENGAGKSTLMHIATGMVRCDSGEIVVHNTPARIRSPRDARRLGIGMVHQHFTLVEGMTVEENVELAVGKVGRGNREWGAQVAGAGGWEPGFTLDPTARVETLSVAEKQRLEILKALATGATILLLDEPTAVLAPPEIDALLATLRRFAEGGGAVVLITHKLREVLACADQVTVLRQGRVTLDGRVQGRSEAELAEAMVGERERGAGFAPAVIPRIPSIARGTRDHSARAGTEIPPPRDARSRDDGQKAVSSHLSPLTSLPSPLPLHPGTILGVAAVEGNGHRELLRALAAQPAAALIPEDREHEGLIGELTLTENVVLGLGARAPWIRGPFVDWAAARRATGALLGEHDVRATGPDAEARTLSGGNQQKLVLARAFARRPAVLVAENPSRGLDIRATVDVHRRLRRAAAEGVAVVVWSSDLDEVLALSDRVVVVRDGRVIAVPAGAGRIEVGRVMLGVGESKKEEVG